MTYGAIALGVAYSADGRWLVTTEFGSEQVNIWNANTMEPVLPLGDDRDGRVWSAQFSNDGRHLVTTIVPEAPGVGMLAVWSVTTPESANPPYPLEVRRVRSFPGQIMGFAIAPDSRYLVWADASKNIWGSPNELYLWDSTGTKAPTRLTDDVRGYGGQPVDVTPDSRGIIVVDVDRCVVTYDVPTGRKVASFPTLGPDYKGPSSWNLKLNLSPDGRTLALSTPSLSGVQLWQRESGRLLYALPDEVGGVSCLKWTPDGRRLAVARSDGQIAIWNLAEIERLLRELGLAP